MRTYRFIPSLIASACLAFYCAQAYAGITIEGPLSHEKPAQPGETYGGIISIRNTGTATVEVKVYQTDYAFSADGLNNFGPPGRLPRSNAGWTRLSQEQIAIPAGSVANVHYDVKVPDDARLSGSYWSVVMVEPLAAKEQSRRDPKKSTVQLSQVIRYAVQLVTDIGEQGSKNLVFSHQQLLEKDGKRLLTVDAENTGEQWMSPQFSLELHDTAGYPVKKLNGGKKRLYPSTSARFEFDLTELPAGKYHALITADGGGDALFGTELDLTF